MSDTPPTYYAILGVPNGALPEDSALLSTQTYRHSRLMNSPVRKAYKQKVLTTHPDKLPPEATVEEKQAAHEEFGKVR